MVNDLADGDVRQLLRSVLDEVLDRFGQRSCADELAMVVRDERGRLDDNAHVEQKNWMWPRQLLGYGRLEQERLVEPINSLYKEVWGPLQNFFLPSMKLVKKWRVGSRWVRRYDRPQTAYQRLLSSDQLKRAEVARLQERYEALDPFKLAAEIERRLLVTRFLLSYSL